MINSPTIGTMALLIQAAVQPAAVGMIISPFESSTLWIGDLVPMITQGLH